MAVNEVKNQNRNPIVWLLIAAVVVVPVLLLVVRDNRTRVLYQPEHKVFVQKLLENETISKKIRFVESSDEKPDFAFAYAAGTFKSNIGDNKKVLSDNYPLFLNNIGGGFIPLALNPLLNFKIDNVQNPKNINYSLAGADSETLVAFVITNSGRTDDFNFSKSLVDFNLLVQSPKAFDKKAFSVGASDAVQFYATNIYNNLPILYSQYRTVIDQRDQVRFKVSALHPEKEFALGLEVFGLQSLGQADQAKLQDLRAVFDSKEASAIIAKNVNMMSANLLAPVTDEVELIARQAIARSSILVALNLKAKDQGELAAASRALLAAPSDAKNIVSDFSRSQLAK